MATENTLEQIKAALGNLPERLAVVLAAQRQRGPGQTASDGLPARLADTPEGRQRLLGDRMGQSLAMQDVQLFGASLKGLFTRKQDATDGERPGVPRLSGQVGAAPPLPTAAPVPAIIGRSIPDDEWGQGKKLARRGEEYRDMVREMRRKLDFGTPHAEARDWFKSRTGSDWQDRLASRRPKMTENDSTIAAGSRGDGIRELSATMKELVGAVNKLREDMTRGGRGSGGGAADPAGTGIARTPGQTVATASRSFAPDKGGPTVGSSTRPRLTTTVVDSQTFTRMRG